MKRNTFIILSVAFLLTSCYGSKEAYINKWTDLADNTLSNYESYTSSDWNNVNHTFRKLQRKEKHYSLTPSETLKVKKAQATILLYEGKSEGKSIIDELKGLIEIGTELFKNGKKE